MKDNFPETMIRNENAACGTTSQSRLRLASFPGRKDSLRPEGDVANSDRGRTNTGEEMKFAQCQSLSYKERCHRR